jgi:hypothetical protein
MVRETARQQGSYTNTRIDVIDISIEEIIVRKNELTPFSFTSSIDELVWELELSLESRSEDLCSGRQLGRSSRGRCRQKDIITNSVRC